MPAYFWLNEFGALVQAAFGATAYQVGSSVESKQWRDVDVRLIMSDEQFAQWFGPIERVHANPLFHALTLAFAELGKRMTGLPIDFQIQQQSDANAKHKGVRNALIVAPNRGLSYSGPTDEHIADAN